MGAREQYPMMRGFCSNRRKWIAAVRYLGNNWITLRPSKLRKVRPLRVVGA